MSKRMASLKRSLLVLSVGGCTFILPGLWGGWGGGWGGCDRYLQNSDIIGFYQGVGDNAIDRVVDSTYDTARGTGLIGGDLDALTRGPVNGILSAMWNNWVWLTLPKDPERIPVVEE